MTNAFRIFNFYTFPALPFNCFYRIIFFLNKNTKFGQKNIYIIGDLKLKFYLYYFSPEVFNLTFV